MGEHTSVTSRSDFDVPEDPEAFHDVEESLLDDSDWKGLVHLYLEGSEQIDDETVELRQLTDHLEQFVEELDDESEIAEVCLCLGDLYSEELGESQAAKQAYRTAFVNDTSNTRSLEKAREIYRKEDNDDLILKLYELEQKVAQSDEVESLVLTRKAQAHAEYRGDFDRALELLDEAMELDPDNRLAERTLEVYGDNQRLEDAVEEMVQLASDAESQDRAMAGRLFYKAGWLEWFREGGSRDRARAIAERAIDCAPGQERIEDFYETVSETGDAAEVDEVELAGHPSEVALDEEPGEPGEPEAGEAEADEANEEATDAADEGTAESGQEPAEEPAAEEAGDGETSESEPEVEEPSSTPVAAEGAEIEGGQTIQGRPGVGGEADSEPAAVAGETMQGRPGVPETEDVELGDIESFYEQIPPFEGDYDQALDVWEDDPDDLSAFVRIRDRLREEGAWEELAEKLEETVKYLRKEEGESQLMGELARVYWKELEDFEEAEHYFKRLKLLDNDHPDVAAFYEDYYERNEQWRRLFSHLKSRAEAAEDRDEQLRYVERRAEVAEREMESPEKAIDVWKQFLRETGERTARVELERLYEEHGKWEGLVDFLKDEVRRLEEEGEETKDRRIELLTRMVDLYEDEIDHQVMAMNTLREIVELDPENTGAFERLRDMMEESRRWNDLIELLSERAERYLEEDEVERAADTYSEIADILEEDLTHVSRAVEYLEQALEVAPHRDDLRRRLASIYEEKRDFDALYDLRVRELEQYEGSERLQRLYDLLELVREKLRDEERMVPILEEIIEIDSGNLEALEELEEVYRRQEDWEELRDVLRRKADLLSDGGARVEALREAGAIQEDHLGGGSEAIETWERVLEEEPDDEGAVDRLGELYVEEGDFDRLEELYRERNLHGRLYDLLMEAAPELEETEAQRRLFRMAADVADEELGDRSRVIESLLELLDVTDRRGEVAEELADHFRETGELEREVEATKIQLEHADTDEQKRRAVVRLSQLEEERESFADALSWQIEAIELDPTRLEALDRAERLADVSDGYATLVELLEAIAEELDEELRVDYWRRIGRLEGEQLDRQEAAIEHLERVREARPGDVETLDRLADLYEAAGRPEDLVDVLESVVEQRRESPADERDLVDAMSRIADVRREHLGDAEGARELYEEILELEPDHRPSVDGMASFYREREEWDEVIEWRERELGLLTTDEIDRRLEVQYQLAELYRRRREDPAEALHYYRQILEFEPDYEPAIEGAKELLDDTTVARETALLLEPIFRETGEWEDLARTLEARRAATEDDFEQLEVLDDLVSLYRDELRDEDRAFERAVDQFRVDPERERIWDRLEDLAASLDRWEDVEQLYASALPEEESEATEERERLMRRVARIRRTHLDEPEGAVDVLERLHAWNPEETEVVEALESLYRHLERDEDLVRILEDRAEYATTDGDRIDHLEEAARLYEESLEDSVGAIEAYREILTIDPADERALDGLERLYRERESWVELEELYLDQIERLYDPTERRERLLQLAELRIEELGDFEGAEEVLSDLLAEDPGDEEVVEALEALEQKLVESETERPDLRLDVAESLEPVYRERRNPERLIAMLEVQLEATKDPFDRLEFLDELTTLHVQRVGDRETGFELLREAVRLDPEDEGRREQLVALGRQLEELGAVVDTLQESLQNVDDFAAGPINRTIGELSERELEDYERAIEAYERVLEFDEADEEALRALERLYEETEQVEELTENLRRQTYYADPDRRVDLFERIGQLERDVLERPERAIEAYNELLDLEPDARRALDVLEQLYERREEWFELSDILRRKADVVADLDEKVETLSKLGDLYVGRLEDPEEAVGVYQRILEIDATHLEANRALERLYEETDRWPDLADVLRQRLMLLEEDEPGARNEVELKLADVLREELYETDDAIERYRNVLARDPGRDRAIEGLEALAEEPSQAEEVEEDLAEYYLNEGSWDRLVDLYELRKEQVNDPVERAEYAYESAKVHAQRGDRHEAFESLAEAWRLDPTNETYRSELSALATEDERWEEFAAVVEDVLPDIREPDERVDLHLRLAEIKRDRLDDPVGAEDHYREVLAVDDTRMEAFDALDELLVEQERWHDLVDTLEQKYDVVAGTDPDTTHDLLVRSAYLQENKLDDPYAAIDCYERLLESAPGHDIALSELQRLYREQERWEDLAEHLERRIEMVAEPERVVELTFELAEVLRTEIYRQRDAVDRYGEILDLEIEHDETVEALEKLQEDQPDLAPEVAPLLERAYRYRERWEDVFDTLLERASVVEDESERVGIWEEAASIAEERLDDYERGYQVAENLFEAEPERDAVRANIGRLAACCEAWNELAALYGDVIDREVPSGDPLRAELFYERGEIFESRLESLEEARHAYEEALAESDELDRARDALERVLTRLEDWSGLADFYRDRAEARAEIGAVKDWLEKLARLEEVVRYDVDSAIEAYYDILDVDPDDEHAHSAIQRLLAYDNRWYDLADRYREEIDRAESEDRRIDVKFRLAQLQEGELDDVEDAIRLYSEILENRPQHRDTLRALEGLRRDLANREGTWRDYRLSIIDELEEHYDVSSDWRRMLKLLESRREMTSDPSRRTELLVEEAELIDDQAQDDVERVPGLTKLGEAYCLQPQRDELWEQFEEFADDLDVWARVPSVLLDGLRTCSDPECQSAILIRLGDVYWNELDDRDSAIAAYQQAADIRADEESLERLESLYSESELWEPLVEILEYRLDRADEPDERRRILERLGTLHDEILERPAEAATYYEDLRVEEPDDLQYYDALESIYERTGQYEQLEELLRERLELIDTVEEQVRVLRRLATIQDEYLEKAEAAIETYEELREVGGDEGQILEALTRLFERTHRWPQLLETLETRREYADGLDDVNELDFRRGHIQLEKMGDPVSAYEAFESILERDAEFEQAREAMADLAARPQTGARAADYLQDLYRSEEDWEALEDLFEEQLEVVDDPDRRGEIFMELSQLHEEELDNPQLAFAMLGRAFRELPGKVYIRHELDRLSGKLENPEELLAMYEDALDSDVTDPDVACDLHRKASEIAADRLEDRECAIEHAESALEVDEYDEETLELLDRFYQETHAWEDLADTLERRLELAEPDALNDIRFRLGYLQEVMFENFDEALDYYREVVQDDPEHGGVIDGLERMVEDEELRLEVAELLEPAYRERGDWSKLIELLELQIEVVEEPREVADLNRRIAELQIEKQDRREIGFAYLGRALRADPHDEQVRDRIEDLTLQGKRYDEIVALYEELLESLTDPVRVLEFAESAAEWAHEKLDQPERAADLYRKVLEVEPEHDEALEALESIARELDEKEDLAEVLERRAEHVYESDEQREVLVELGEVCMELERFEQAADAYQQALLLDESDTEVMQRLVGLYEVTEKYEELVDILDRLTNYESAPEQLVRLHMQIGRYCQNFIDDPDRAIRAYREVLEHEPGHEEALAALEDLYREQERWAPLEDILEESLERAEKEGDDDEIARVCVELGTLSYNRFGDVEPAVDWFNRALEIESGHPDVIEALEEIYREEEDWDALMELLDDQFEQAEDEERKAELLTDMARINLEYLDDPEAADDLLDRAFEFAPGQEYALEVRADVCEAREDWESLLDVRGAQLSNAETDEEEIAIREKRAELYAERRDNFEEAIRDYQEILELEPLHERALQRAVELYGETGNLHGTYSLLEHEAEHVEGEDEKVELFLEMADLAAEEIESPELAVDALERAYEFRPEDLDIAEPLVEAYLDAGRVEDAEPLIEEIIALLEDEGRDDEAVRFQHLRGSLYEEKGELERALETYQGVVDKDDSHIPSLLSLGKLAYEMEDWEKAKNTFQKLLLHQMKLESDDQKVDVYYYLGLIYRELDDERKAKDMFNRALSLNPNHEPSEEEIEAIES